MSKVPQEQIAEAVATLMDYSTNEKKRNFVETVELQFTLTNYDPSKDKRFSGSIALPLVPRPRLKVCLLGTEKDCEKAKAIGLPFKAQDELKGFKKNKKKVKKLANAHDAFLCSSSMIRQIPRILGPGLNKAGKFPTAFGPTEDLASKVEFLKRTIKFQMKKVLTLNVAVAHVEMSEEEITANVQQAVNFLISLLKKGWQNIKCIYLKSTMGPPQRLF